MKEILIILTCLFAVIVAIKIFNEKEFKINGIDSMKFEDCIKSFLDENDNDNFNFTLNDYFLFFISLIMF